MEVGGGRSGDGARGGVLLRAAGHDQDHERGLGDLLALEDHDDAGLLTDSELVTTPTTTRGRWRRGRGLNPYKLGVELYRDIEDRWNKGRFGKEYEDCEDIERRRSWDTEANWVVRRSSRSAGFTTT
jgi:hypothetical protein